MNIPVRLRQTNTMIEQSQSVLGIDIAKDSLVIFDQRSNQTIECANKENDLSDAMKRHGWNPDNNVVAIESTGDYSYLAMQFFVKKKFTVKLINPIVTKKFIRATVRGKKTDKTDAQAIAQIVAYGEGQTVVEKDLDTAKKTLLRLERKLTGQLSDFKRMKKSLETKQQNGIMVERAVEQIGELISIMETAIKNVWSMTREEPIDRQEEIIQSHIGCGEKLSAIISSEAGDIKRFPSPKQFKAYAGIDPKVYQSGDKDTKGKMTKRGNSFLRHALFLAAFVASQHDPELKVYYQKKRSEGKSFTLSVCAVSRKLCERIYATVIQNRLYEARYPQGEALTMI